MWGRGIEEERGRRRRKILDNVARRRAEGASHMNSWMKTVLVRVNSKWKDLEVEID